MEMANTGSGQEKRDTDLRQVVQRVLALPFYALLTLSDGVRFVVEGLDKGVGIIQSAVFGLSQIKDERPPRDLNLPEYQHPWHGGLPPTE